MKNRNYSLACVQNVYCMEPKFGLKRGNSLWDCAIN